MLVYINLISIPNNSTRNKQHTTSYIIIMLQYETYHMLLHINNKNA